MKYEIGDIIYGLLMEGISLTTCDNRTIQPKKEDIYMYLGKVVWTKEEVFEHCYYHFPSGGLIPFSHEIVTPFYDNNK